MRGSREGTGGPGDPGAKTIHPGKSQVYVGFLTEIPVDVIKLEYSSKLKVWE